LLDRRWTITVSLLPCLLPSRQISHRLRLRAGKGQGVSLPEAPATTDIERVLQNQDLILAKLGELTLAVNGLGANQQWLIDNVKGIFQMFSNPQFMAQLPQMMGGMGHGPAE
jgi:hypothetical protein